MSYGQEQCGAQEQAKRAIQEKYAAEQMRGMQNMYPQGLIGQAVLGNALTQRPLSPIEGEMNGLSEMLGALHSRVAVLEDRLRPVLVMQPEKDSPGMPVPVALGVPLADHIRSLFDTATVLRDRLDRLIDRVAL